jgi:hypothetical protein
LSSLKFPQPERKGRRKSFRSVLSLCLCCHPSFPHASADREERGVPMVCAAASTHIVVKSEEGWHYAMRKRALATTSYRGDYIRMLIRKPQDEGHGNARLSR